jgi:hypothetical protein
MIVVIREKTTLYEGGIKTPLIVRWPTSFLILVKAMRSRKRNNLNLKTIRKISVSKRNCKEKDTESSYFDKLL